VILSWIATAICVLRGAPVLWEARTRLKDMEGQMAKQAGK